MHRPLPVTVSRRALLAGLPAVAAAVAALTGCRSNSRRTVVDVREFGARGDGTTDDSQAIQAAAAAVRSHSTLYFPTGTYRFAQRRPLGAAAVIVSGVSDVTVEFGPGAELLMDNLDPNRRTGTSHGLLVRGPALRISLRNVTVRWVDGAKRSLGDGIRVVGCPTSGAAPPTGWSGPRAPVAGINLTDCVVRGSPQTGVVMLGVSDIGITGLRVTDSGADGLHFNACRRARIDGYNAVNPGDDGLAMVTYFARRPSFDTAAHTFSFPSLTEWSNADFTVDNVSVVGSKANGIRIAGAQRVAIRALEVVGAQAGSAVMVDSAEPGMEVGWHYVASRSVRIEDVVATDCDTGIHLLARTGSSDQLFTDFDVHVAAARLDGCANWSLQTESLTEHRMSGLRVENCSIWSGSTAGGNGGVGINNADGIALGNITIRHAEPVLAFQAKNAGHLSVDRLSVAIQSENVATDAKPCVSLEGSDGVIRDMQLGWSAAPSSWIPVRMAAVGHCVGSSTGASVAIGSLTVTPSSASPVQCS